MKYEHPASNLFPRLHPSLANPEKRMGIRFIGFAQGKVRFDIPQGKLCEEMPPLVKKLTPRDMDRRDITAGASLCRIEAVAAS